jgi:hypothetical protein
LALALNETATELFVSVATTSDTGRVERYTLPLTAGTVSRRLDLLDGADKRCDASVMVLRDAYLFAACTNADGASTARTFLQASGVVHGLSLSITAPVVAVDHDLMVMLASSAAGNSAVGYVSPTTDPERRVTMNSDQTHVGVGLMDSGAFITGAVTRDPGGAALNIYSYSASPSPSFTLHSQLPVTTLLTISRITSGRPAAQQNPVNPIVVVDAVAQVADVWDGAQLLSQASPLPVRTLTGLTLPISNIVFKVSRDSQYAYYLSQAGEPCRVPLAGGVPTCAVIPSGCGPVDLVPGHTGAPTFVACGNSPYLIVSYPGF